MSINQNLNKMEIPYIIEYGVNYAPNHRFKLIKYATTWSWTSNNFDGHRCAKLHMLCYLLQETIVKLIIIIQNNHIAKY